MINIYQLRGDNSSHAGKLDLLLLEISLSDGVLVEVSLEDTCEDAAEQSASNVCGLVDQWGLWSTWVDSCVHHSLENWLDHANGWVHASAGNTLGDLDAGVVGDSNGSGIQGHISGSVVLNDLDDEAHEEESHDELNPEHLSDHFSVIAAAIVRAQLLQVVATLRDLIARLGAQREAHQTDAAADHGSDGLGNNDQEGVQEGGTAQVVSVLDENSDGHCWVEVPATYWAKYLGHRENAQTHADWRVFRGATPVEGSCEHGCAEELGNQHPSLVFTSSWNFHFVVCFSFNYNIALIL